MRPLIYFYLLKVPMCYIACKECGTLRTARQFAVDSTRRIFSSGKSGSICSTCGNNDPKCWLKNLTTDRLTPIVVDILSKNAVNDRQPPATRPCGHRCCREKWDNQYFHTGTIKPCCACTGSFSPCTTCLKERMLTTRYFSCANPVAFKRVLDRVLESISI
jgi:hypothetical protein